MDTLIYMNPISQWRLIRWCSLSFLLKTKSEKPWIAERQLVCSVGGQSHATRLLLLSSAWVHAMIPQVTMITVFFLKKQNTSSPWLNAKWNNGLQPPWAFYPLLYLLRSYAKKLFVGLVFRSVLHCILSSYLPRLSNTNLCWASLLLPLTHAINRWIQRSLFCLERGMKVPLFPAQSLCLVCY